MPRKKDGMPFEVHPTPAKGRDGKNIFYVKPAMRNKMTMSGVEDFCSRNYGLRYGELARAFDVFLRAAGLTYYSARKQLNQWTEGQNPKLLKTRRGQEFIYTEI